MIRVVHPEFRTRIRMLTFSYPGSRIQGSKRHPIPDPGSGSATLVKGQFTILTWLSVGVEVAAKLRLTEKFTKVNVVIQLCIQLDFDTLS
jgi:hypothetical protein